MTFPKFAPYQWICVFIIACLKPFTVVSETLFRKDVGERYAGFSALAALALLGCLAGSLPKDDAAPVWMVMAAFAIRVVMIRKAGIERRRRGDHSIHTRSPGRFFLTALRKRMSPTNATLIEPFTLTLIALVLTWMNPTVGGIFYASAIAVVCINLVRLSAAYNKAMDAADAELEREDQPFARLVACPPVSPLSTAPRMNVRSFQTDLFPCLANNGVEGRQETGGYLLLGEGIQSQR